MCSHHRSDAAVLHPQSGCVGGRFFCKHSVTGIMYDFVFFVEISKILQRPKALPSRKVYRIHVPMMSFGRWLSASPTASPSVSGASS